MKIFSSMMLVCWACLGQDAGNKITVPFSDPGRPRTVRGSMIQGCFSVEGYDGKDVIVEARRRAEHPSPRPPRNAEGMNRIEPAGMGLTVEEENNTVRIHGSPGSGGDVVVRVPYSTSLKLECMNGGEMKVERVTGDLELQNLNGGVSALNVSGSVVAHSLNGRVVVGLDKAAADKPMSFSSLNGDIDVTFPADMRGTVKMKTDHGEIYSDFEIRLNASAAPVIEDGRAKGGKYRVKMDSATVGSLNGGGPELSFKTLNGNIYIRKKK